MSLKDKHVYERNKLAFKFGTIIMVFEILSTIVYQASRVGFLTTNVMLVIQALIAGFFIYSYLRYSKRNRGKYLMMASLIGSYFVVMLGSVHITYIWAFGPALLIEVLLFADNTLTLATAALVVAINAGYLPLFYKYSVEVEDRRHAVSTDLVFSILISLMAIFYVRLNSKHNGESMEEIEEGARQQEENARVMKEIGEQIAAKLEDANDADVLAVLSGVKGK